MGMYNSGLTALTTLVTVGVLIAGGIFLTTGRGECPRICITFLLYINNFTEPVKKLVNSAEQFRWYTGFERFWRFSPLLPDISDKPDAVSMENMQGDIEFKNVSFHYEDNEGEGVESY